MLSILLIEHHADSRIVTERLLSRSGYAVRAVPDVDGALAGGDQAAPSVLISDVIPPEGMAEEAAALRARFPGVPAILLTCVPESFVSSTVATLAPCEVLMKPFVAEDLCAAIARACMPEEALPGVKLTAAFHAWN